MDVRGRRPALTGVTFPEAWPTRTQGQFGPVTAGVIGLDAFVANKRATGRAKDIGDVESLLRGRDGE